MRKYVQNTRARAAIKRSKKTITENIELKQSTQLFESAAIRRVEWQSKSVATCCVAIILCGRTNENWISRSFDMQTDIWCDSIMHCNNERNNESIFIEEQFGIKQKVVSVLPYWNRHSAETALPRHPCQMFCERKKKSHDFRMTKVNGKNRHVNELTLSSVQQWVLHIDPHLMF